MTKLTKKEIQKKEAVQKLLEILETEGYNLKTKLLHVSRSGLMRSIVVFTEKSNINITDLVAIISDYKIHNTGGLKVQGCGMDMGFHVVYNLSVSLFCQEGYSQEGAYKLKHTWI